MKLLRLQRDLRLTTSLPILTAFSAQLQEAYDLGVRTFGENKVQEIQDKKPQLPSDIQWHMIGHLQTNKVKQVVGKVDLIQSIDSYRLLEAVQKEAAKQSIVQDILLELLKR